MYKIILFLFATTAIIWLSRHSLRIQHHGFYRFFGWETILILFLFNVESWFVDPFSFNQIISWSFLTISLILIFQGVQLFRKQGNIDRDRKDPQLLGVEKTTELVTTGIYHYIRHPFYSSLLFLGWGIFFKNVNWLGLILAVINTVFLVITAQKEENENIEYFGEKYRLYIEQTKMFIPFIF
jgi:protein-S-isoprenylcysteine O-methyltransferase Ste14